MEELVDCYVPCSSSLSFQNAWAGAWLRPLKSSLAKVILGRSNVEGRWYQLVTSTTVKPH